MDTMTTPTLDLAQMIEETFIYYGNPPQGMRTVFSLDRTEGHFLMVHVGHYHNKYRDDLAAHLELCDGHIYVHDEDAGMNFIAANLIAQGVPRDKITVVAHPDWYIEKA